ncbi:hypothetical protein BC567DRAFT_246721 [Phyllosticta citribraziliensis]
MASLSSHVKRGVPVAKTKISAPSCTETTVVTTTITPSPVEALLRQQYAAENGREPAQGDDVPMYAWPCDVDRYAEVCSCLGFPATTITELAWTAIETLTLTKTQTLSGSPVFPNVTRSLASSWQCNKRHFQQLLAEHWEQSSLLDAFNIEA